MAKKDFPLVVANISLASIPDRIKDVFSRFDELIVKPNEVRDFAVETSETLNIAESKIRSINRLKTEIETKRKDLKDPLNFLGNIIQGEAKRLDDELTMSKSILNKKVTTYKELKLAQLRKEEEKKKEQERKEIERKEKILSRISSILSTFTSLMFGGEVPNKDGELIPVSEPETKEDLEKIKIRVEKSFPDFDLFEEYSNKVSEYYISFIEDLESYIGYIEEADMDGIRRLKRKYYRLCDRTEQNYHKTIEKEEENIEKKIQQEYKQAGKNIREYVKFDVFDISVVPERLKIVDEYKVRDYVKRNQDLIKEKIKNNKGSEIIPGITFRVERKNVTI